MEKSSLSSQNFNQSVVKILSIHKTNWIKKKKEKKKRKAKGKKCDRRRLREIVRTLQRWRRGRLKRFGGSGQERRCGKWIRINISSSIAWLLRKKKNVPIIQSCPAVNGAGCILLFFCVTLALFTKLQMISFCYLTFFFFFPQLVQLVLKELSIAFEMVQYLNDIVLREATDVFFSLAISVATRRILEIYSPS